MTTDTAHTPPSGPAEPDIGPVPDAEGHFVVGYRAAVGAAEAGGARETPGVAYGGRFAPEALMAALDELSGAYDHDRALAAVARIFDTTGAVLRAAGAEGTSTLVAAEAVARRRLRS